VDAKKYHITLLNPASDISQKPCEYAQQLQSSGLQSPKRPDSKKYPITLLKANTTNSSPNWQGQNPRSDT